VSISEPSPVLMGASRDYLIICVMLMIGAVVLGVEQGLSMKMLNGLGLLHGGSFTLMNSLTYPIHQTHLNQRGQFIDANIDELVRFCPSCGAEV
jgi:hypothetical protein